MQVESGWGQGGAKEWFLVVYMVYIHWLLSGMWGGHVCGSKRSQTWAVKGAEHTGTGAVVWGRGARTTSNMHLKSDNEIHIWAIEGPHGPAGQGPGP